MLALLVNATGNNNIANGHNALYTNTTGDYNTAIGLQTLYGNTNGQQNTACGSNALLSNSNGDGNTASGVNALRNNTLGISNTALGNFSGFNVTTASNVICIGANVAGENVSDTCFIGNIRDVTTAIPDAIPVLIDSAGQLGTASSSRRYKSDIKPMDKASEPTLALKPVSFRYKVHKDTTPQFGLIAEELAQVNPDLVVRDKNGEIYTVRYDAVNAMLLNEFLKEHRKVEEQQAIITELKSTVAQQQQGLQTVIARVEQQAAEIQKMSAQFEAGGTAPQIVLNNRK